MAETVVQVVGTQPFDEIEKLTTGLSNVLALISQINEAGKDIRFSATNVQQLTDAANLTKKLADNTDEMSTAVTEAVTTTQKLSTTVSGVAEAMARANSTLGNYNRTLLSNAQEIANNKLRIDQLNVSQGELRMQYELGTVALDKYTEASGVLIAERETLKILNAELLQSFKAETKEIIAGTGSIDQITQSLGRMRDAWRNMTPEQKAANQEMLRTIQLLDAQKKAGNGEIGNYQDNVGHYPGGMGATTGPTGSAGPNLPAAGSVNALKADLKSLESEYYALGEAEQKTFYGLAMKQNIDETRGSIKALTTTERELKVETQAGADVFDKFGSKVESMGIRMAVSLTIFAAAQAIFESISKAMDRSLSLLNVRGQTIIDINTKSAESFATEATEIEFMRSRFESATATMSDKKEIVEELNDKYGKQVGAIKSIGDAEDFFVKKSAAFIDALMLRAQAAGALEVATEKAKENIINKANGGADLVDNIDAAIASVKAFGNMGGAAVNIVATAQERLSDKTKANNEAIKVAQTEYINLMKQAKALDDKFKFNTDADTGKGKKTPKGKSASTGLNEELSAQKELNDATANLATQRGRQEQEIQKDIFDNDKKTLNERLAAYDKFQQASITIANIEAAREKENAEAKLKEIADKEKLYSDGKIKLNAQELKALKVSSDAANEQIAAAKEKQVYQLDKITTEGDKKQKQFFMDNLKEQFADMDAETTGKLAAIQQKVYNKTTEILNNPHLTSKQKKEQITSVGNAAAVEADQTKVTGLRDDQVKLYDAQQNPKTATSKADYVSATEALEKKITDIKEQERNKQLTAEEAANAKRIAGQKAVEDAAISAVQTSIAAQEQIEQNHYSQELLNLQTLQQSEQIKTQQELQNVQATANAGIQKQQQLSAINATAQAQQNQINAETRKIEKEQAESQREAAISQAIINTAVAVTKALGSADPPYSFILAAIAGAAGAAQVAAAESTPIPQFWTGVSSSPEGWAWTGEQGPELFKTPSGKVGLTPGTATLSYLEAGTEILSNEKTMSLYELAYNAHSTEVPAFNNGVIIDLSSLEYGLKVNADRTIAAIQNMRPVVFKGVSNNSTWMVQSTKK